MADAGLTEMAADRFAGDDSFFVGGQPAREASSERLILVQRGGPTGQKGFSEQLAGQVARPRGATGLDEALEVRRGFASGGR